MSFGMGKARTKLVLAYVGGLRLSAVRVMTGKAGEMAPCWLICETEPALVETGPHAAFDTLWFEKAAHAELVYHQCLRSLGVEQAETIELTATEVRDTAVNEAANLGALWRSTQEVVSTAENAVDEIERHIRALNASGALAPLNAGYKSYRLAMQSTGTAATSYSNYLLSFKIRMAKQIAENVASGGDKFAGLSSILPGSLGLFKHKEEFTDTPASSRTYVNRSWSNHSFKKR